MIQRLSKDQVKNVVFKFTENECYKEKSGRCSLEDMVECCTTEKTSGKRNSKEYCQNLYRALLINKFDYPDFISIAKLDCGHYEVSDGRHRLCICQQMDMGIDEVDVDDGRNVCWKCRAK